MADIEDKISMIRKYKCIYIYTLGILTIIKVMRDQSLLIKKIADSLSGLFSVIILPMMKIMV